MSEAWQHEEISSDFFLEITMSWTCTFKQIILNLPTSMSERSVCIRESESRSFAQDREVKKEKETNPNAAEGSPEPPAVHKWGGVGDDVVVS